MKLSTITFYLLALIYFGLSSSITACEIEAKIKGEQKYVYSKGDILILEVNVFLTHRDCPEGINSTKYQGSGIKLLGAKKWQQLSSERFTTLLKVEITDTNNGEAVLHVRRSCDKEGGHAVLNIKVK